ncbi:MAG: hypothetical protein KF749_10370 [Bacteroidetes bacterium]|nr:hypothetical protein [Bacteroidota bacterium]MCW5895830.1 hypothetical protein [Bacteroidota bacterium]
MKKLVAVTIVMLSVVHSGSSQTINWRSLGEDQRNVIQLNVGFDYGVTAQAVYGRAFTFIRPVMVGVDFSLPMGENLVDDFKAKLGVQIEVVEMGGFSATLRIFSIFRRYENELVRIVSFGSDLGLVAGYYSPTWHVAGEFGFDKSIVSHLKHSDVMRSYYPRIRDGWYIPSGGHFYYGIQAGKTLGQNLDLTLRVGATNAQHSDEEAAVPYYLQLGLGMRF